jgi:hydroxypyruvate reductase
MEKLIFLARHDLLEIYQAALHRVNGRNAVRDALEVEPLETPFDLVAIGKAAESMAKGVTDVCNDHVQRGLVITKHGHLESRFDQRFHCIESDHPVPGSASLQAGNELLAFCKSIPQGRAVLFCLSGGTSSLVEVLPHGMTLADLQTVNQILLGSGLVIDQINTIRSSFSLIKGGRLVAIIGERPAKVLLLSDVPGDNPAVIGSGPLYPQALVSELKWPAQLESLRRRFSLLIPKSIAEIPHQIIANQKMALLAAKEQAKELGYPVHLHSKFLDADVNEVAEYFTSYLQNAPAGVHLWGGEPVVTLPENPDRGGRNQHLALIMADRLNRDRNIVFMAVGSDGTDGTTEDAGAMIDGDSRTRGEAAGLNAKLSLRQFDSGHFLEKSGDLVFTGPTGTNVMDFVMLIKQQPS